ncbi:Origin recognition complex, subunit 1 [Arachnomyces sp. PD_36]|nr:Origin recognition complex, subunit 1 [Arachnomyces sp. PD_36]
MAPAKKPRATAQSKRSQQARQWLTTAHISRDDSDDELGVEDLPWEWIYETDDGNGTGEGQGNAPGDEASETPSRTRRNSRKGRIIGARMGSFECKIGQAVLLKSPEAGKDWAGIICEFLEEEDEEEEMVKSANIMWFVSPQEFASTRRKQRADALPNEQYITKDFNVNPLSSVNGRACVMSKDAFYNRYPDGAAPRGLKEKAEYNKCIVCRRGVNQLQGKYTEEFIWEDIHKESMQGVLQLIDRIKSELKLPTKRKQVDTDYTDVKEDNTTPRTPKKKQKTISVAETPQSKRGQKILSTPNHQRISVKDPIQFTPLGTRVLSPSHYVSSPYRQARSLLHVSSVPTSLPGRSKEFEKVYTSLSDAITGGTGACIYISGTPGTGKTATVREVVAQLNSAVMAEEMDNFVFVEINGMKVTDPNQSYSLLWEALKGDRVSPPYALDLLQQEFSNPSPRRVPCVVLMDELDQLASRNQTVMYNFFNWPVHRHSHLIVLAVANTMDLPERTLSNKVSSRLGLIRITFPGYTHTQLMEIIGSRLANVPGNIVALDAIQFASRKVAAVSGDARRALDICRRAVEIAEEESEQAAGKAAADEPNQEDITPSLPPTPSKAPTRQARSRVKTGDVAPETKVGPQKAKPPPLVTIAIIKQAIQEAATTPLQQALHNLPLSTKLFLAALLSRIRRTGLAESSIGDILDEAKRIAQSVAPTSDGWASELKVHSLPPLPGTETAVLQTSRVIYPTAKRVQGIGHAAVDLMRAGILILEGGAQAKARFKSGQRSRRVMLAAAEEDVRAAFGDDPEARGLGIGIGQ